MTKSCTKRSVCCAFCFSTARRREHNTRTVLRILFQAFPFFLFIRTFAKLRKKKWLSFVMSVYPSAWNKQLGFHWTDEGNILVSSSWNEKYFTQNFWRKSKCTFYRLFQITNLMHNSFILQQYVCYITILNMFRVAPFSSSGG